MSTTTLSPRANTFETHSLTSSRNAPVPPLENGAHLSATEFLRRYDAMPDVKKAELIQGVVYISSPVRARDHGRQDNLCQWWLGSYVAATDGVDAYSNSTVRLSADDVPQPDIVMCQLPSRNGNASINSKGFIVGSPELVIEIAASSASYDTKEKLETYRRFGVRELLFWLTEENRILWLHLNDDEYVTLPTEPDGVIQSRVFPGLWLDVNAMLAFDRKGVRSALERGLASAEHAAFVK